jgi:transporter family-2 protein
METIIIAIFYAILAGSVVATQNVFSTQISHKIGMWETTVIVHLFGLIFALIISFFFGKGSYKNISDINKLYLLAGPLGVIIIFSVTMGVSKLGATFAIAIMVISQLSFATVIDSFGLFGMDKIPLNLTKLIGLVVMIIGLMIFQLRA